MSTDFWHPQGSCWACRVLEGALPGFVVAERPDVAVLLNPFPLNPGHALVIPRRHVQNVYELPEELAGPILVTAALVARAAKYALGADGVTLRQNNEAASDQHLFHFHLHVIPRFQGDGGRFNAAPRLANPQDQEEIASRLRAAVARLGG